MKKYMTLAAVAAFAAFSVSAQAAAPAPAAAAAPAEKKVEVVAAAPAAEKLSAEETQFTAKLNERHRKVFAEKFSAQQRKAAMTAAATVNADEAVQKVMGDSKITMAEKCETSACEAKK